MKIEPLLLVEVDGAKFYFEHISFYDFMAMNNANGSSDNRRVLDLLRKAEGIEYSDGKAVAVEDIQSGAIPAAIVFKILQAYKKALYGALFPDKLEAEEKKA